MKESMTPVCAEYIPAGFIFDPSFCPKCRSRMECTAYQTKHFKKLIPMTPEEFKDEMLKIKKEWYDFPEYNDRETRFRMMNLVCKVLSELGYTDGIKIFEDCLCYDL